VLGIEVVVVVEVHDEALILGIEVLTKVIAAASTGELVTHAAAVVDHQAEADARLLFEDGKFLLTLSSKTRNFLF